MRCHAAAELSLSIAILTPPPSTPGSSSRMECSSTASWATRRSRSLRRCARDKRHVSVAQPQLLTHIAPSQTWGIGYGMNNASEWQEVAKTALKTAVILVILDVLRVTRNSTWFEASPFLVSRCPAASDASGRTGARGFCERAGRAVQRRRTLMVAADAHAGQAAGPPDGRLRAAFLHLRVALQ